MLHPASSLDTKSIGVGPVILLGPPGAGKGTQAKCIEAEVNIPHVSTGEVLRQQMGQETRLGLNARVAINSGMLVPDDLVCHMVGDRIGQPDCARGAILDGFPRTIVQAEWLNRQLQSCMLNADDWGRMVVIKINIEKDELVRRLAGRRSCPVCGRIYGRQFQPLGAANVCDSDGTELITRGDDVEDLICDRLEIYERETLPVAKYYRRKGQLYDIDGNRPVASVAAAILAIIRNR